MPQISVTIDWTRRMEVLVRIVILTHWRAGLPCSWDQILYECFSLKGKKICSIVLIWIYVIRAQNCQKLLGLMDNKNISIMKDIILCYFSSVNHLA